MRLDRWCRLRFPGLQCLSQQAPADRASPPSTERVRANARPGRWPGGAAAAARFPDPSAGRSAGCAAAQAQDRALLEGMILYSDDDIAIPEQAGPGLAVQGGTRTSRHIDGLLESWASELGERPRLVHRLDRDTSGVLVVARRRHVASALGRLFATRKVEKDYWAVVRGCQIRARARWMCRL